MKNNYRNHLFQLTLATLFISTSGPLGKFIDLPTPVIIWWRCVLGALLLFIFIRFKKIELKLKSTRDFKTISASAILLGTHWITYFYALKLSNVALGMLSLFTFPVITALLEPLFIKSKLNITHIILGTLVLTGIYILSPDFNFENTYVKGILLGVFSAFCYSVRNLMLKQHVKRYNGTLIMLYQITILSIVLLPFVFTMGTKNITSQYPYVIMLALLTTSIGHSLFISSLKHFSVSTASIINSIQPIFGIIIAYFFLNETPNTNTFIGGTLIIITVIIESFRSQKSSS